MARKIVGVYISSEVKRLFKKLARPWGRMKARFYVTRFSNTRAL